MVKLSAATGAGQHTCLVGLEDTLIGFDKDGKRLLHESGPHLARVFLSDGSRCGSPDGGLGLRIVQAAGGVATSAGSVGILRLELRIVSLEVSVGPEWIAAIAAHVKVNAGGAIDELLLREGLELASGDEVGTLHGTGGRE